MNRIGIIALAAALLAPWAAMADHPTAFDHLLRQVQEAQQREVKLRREREARFLAGHDNQQQLLTELRQKLADERARGVQLKAAFESNETALSGSQSELKRRTGDLGELFGTVRQLASDLTPLVDESLVSVQYPGRADWLRVLAESTRLPDITELERFWLLIQHEILDSGRIVRFPARVIGVDGVATEREVTRIGLFNVISGGRFLKYSPASNALVELARQPGAHEREIAAAFEATHHGYAEMAIDPTRGVLLGLLVDMPNWKERIQQGGVVGYIILGLGLVGFVVVVVRLFYLANINRRVQTQLEHLSEPATDNPLGRVLSVAQKHQHQDTETLSLQVDESIIRETPRLTRGEGLVKLLAGVAPLLGLLGTVVGMIVTFQSISLFGTGDPKLMADGISQALVTTALGLIVAIPLLFMHSLVSTRSRALVQILEEQSVGLCAAQRESR